MKNIYSEKIEIGIYYTYDINRNKVYDLRSIKEELKSIIKNLQSKSLG